MVVYILSKLSLFDNMLDYIYFNLETFIPQLVGGMIGIFFVYTIITERRESREVANHEGVEVNE